MKGATANPNKEALKVNIAGRCHEMHRNNVKLLTPKKFPKAVPLSSSRWISPMTAAPIDVHPEHPNAWTNLQNKRCRRSGESAVPRLPIAINGIPQRYMGRRPSGRKVVDW